MANKSEQALMGIQKELHELNKNFTKMLKMMQEEDTQEHDLVMAVDVTSLLKKKLDEDESDEEDTDDDIKEIFN